MHHAEVTDKYRITIPRETRERLGIRRGQKMQAVEQDAIITLTPIFPAASKERPGGNDG